MSMVVSQHAIARYMERTGIKSETRAINKIFRLVDNALPLTKIRYYSRGWVMIVVKDKIMTIHKPSKKDHLKINQLIGKKLK